MAKVTGIGGIFFKSKDPVGLMNWYAEKFGIKAEEDWTGTQFDWRDKDKPEEVASTVFSPFNSDTDYFGESTSEFMINLRVDNLAVMLDQLRAAGCRVDEKTEEMEGLGKFGWAYDPEGRKIELWEPVNKVVPV